MSEGIFFCELPSISDDMDIGDSFELERHAGNFSVTHTQNTRLKKQHECGICGISVDTGFDLPKHHEEHSSADVEEKPSGFSVNFEHVTVSAAPHSDLIAMTTGDRNLEISCTVDVITRQSKFSCGICEYFSKFKQNLKRHLKVHHELKKTPKSKSDYKVKKQKCRKNLRCHVCNYTTLYRFNLNRHISQVHSDRQNNQRPTYKCKFCGKELHSKFAQKLHEDTVHTKLFKYTCPTCSKGFNQVIPFKGHLASHYDILKEKCDLCPASFNYKKSLAEHKQVIHEKRNFRCPQLACAAVYSSVRHLRDHARAEHSNDRLPCDKCPKTFKWRSSLKYHKDTAH